MAKTSPNKSSGPLSFQGLILTLQNYWAGQGCVILQPFDTEVGAGTLHARSGQSRGMWPMCSPLVVLLMGVMARTRTACSIITSSKSL